MVQNYFQKIKSFLSFIPSFIYRFLLKFKTPKKPRDDTIWRTYDPSQHHNCACSVPARNKRLIKNRQSPKGTERSD
jgi:hypothetical protein